MATMFVLDRHVEFLIVRVFRKSCRNFKLTYLLRTQFVPEQILEENIVPALTKEGAVLRFQDHRDCYEKWLGAKESYSCGIKKRSSSGAKKSSSTGGDQYNLTASFLKTCKIDQWLPGHVTWESRGDGSKEYTMQEGFSKLVREEIAKIDDDLRKVPLSKHSKLDELIDALSRDLKSAKEGTQQAVNTSGGVGRRRSKKRCIDSLPVSSSDDGTSSQQSQKNTSGCGTLSEHSQQNAPICMLEAKVPAVEKDILISSLFKIEGISPGLAQVKINTKFIMMKSCISLHALEKFDVLVRLRGSESEEKLCIKPMKLLDDFSEIWFEAEWKHSETVRVTLLLKDDIPRLDLTEEKTEEKMKMNQILKLILKGKWQNREKEEQSKTYLVKQEVLEMPPVRLLGH
eukprot:m.160753 g.160753  ORF g.160753 m.160753 type:complete len:400 (+) comp38782_c0_seq2:79-1278(+)